METLSLTHRYAVMQYRDGRQVRVGIIMANNHSHAFKKAMQLYNRHVWVERL